MRSLTHACSILVPSHARPGLRPHQPVRRPPTSTVQPGRTLSHDIAAPTQREAAACPYSLISKGLHIPSRRIHFRPNQHHKVNLPHSLKHHTFPLLRQANRWSDSLLYMYPGDGNILALGPSYQLVRTCLISRYDNCLA